ncbi:hypothetical protein Nepgr_020217 [Nepenthes gracilis]|uniref:Uncharacterized protein n=1 Tax=Nepenthes gracilis TaxID=150966 RepID=A0AAD3XW51_NEPGR|nr:hypothetical protein Nepgr_020217 [Nepenthes gracilis]
MTVTGETDPVEMASKLRKFYRTELISVGPSNGPEGKKDVSGKQKPDRKPKKEEPKDKADGFVKADEAHSPHHARDQYFRSVEEDPNYCIIL